MQALCQWIQNEQALKLFAASAQYRWQTFAIWIHPGPSIALRIPARRAAFVAKQGVAQMLEPISPEAFRVLIDRTGLKLAATQFDELREAFPKLAALAERLKTTRAVADEPAAVFSPKV